MAKKFISKNVLLWHNLELELRVLTKNLVNFKKLDEE